MSLSFDRRDFLKGAAGFAVGGAALEEQILMAHLSQTDKAEPGLEVRPMPQGRIKGIPISRLICGGNLIGGWAHSRDLIYVSRLFKAYNTDDKILETLALCEQFGINSIITNPVSGNIIHRFWNEKGGKIQWISEVHPNTRDYKEGVWAARDGGAAMAYIQGAVADRAVADNNIELLADTINFIKECGMPAGIGAHALEVIAACEEKGLDPDFYVKTLHSDDYWSCRKPEQPDAVIRNPNDNFWCVDPVKTVHYMKQVAKPWIAFKVLAAGAIHPNQGFKFAFENGADFICVGMFDFQIAEDTDITIQSVLDVARERPWQA